MRIGFIGLGIMGRRMAANLMDAGHELSVWNRSPEKGDELVEAGATRAETPADAARGVEVLFTMVATPDAVRQVALGDGGFLEALPEGALWVDSSTVPPAFSREMAEEANQRGIRFADAPVTGTKGPAETGELTFLFGGEDEDLSELEPLFEVMGTNTLHLGYAGQGAAMKMLINMLLGNAMAAFAEALMLGESLGLSQEQLFDVLLPSPAAAPFLAGKKGKIESGDYEADFPLRWMHKDLHQATMTAYDEGVALPLTNAVEEMYALAKRHGLGNRDFSAVYRWLGSS